MKNNSFRQIGGKAKREALGAFLATVTIFFFLGVFIRRAKPAISFDDVQSDDLVVLKATYTFPSTAGQSAYGYLLRDRVGREVNAEFREPLTLNEHVFARYAFIRGSDAVRMDSYTRCGNSPCAPSP